MAIDQTLPLDAMAPLDAMRAARRGAPLVELLIFDPSRRGDGATRSVTE